MPTGHRSPAPVGGLGAVPLQATCVTWLCLCGGAHCGAPRKSSPVSAIHPRAGDAPPPRPARSPGGTPPQGHAVAPTLRCMTEYQVNAPAARAALHGRGPGGDETGEVPSSRRGSRRPSTRWRGDSATPGVDDYLAGWERSSWNRGYWHADPGARPGRGGARGGVAAREGRGLPRRVVPVNRLAALLGADRPVLLDGGMGNPAPGQRPRGRRAR